MKIHFSFLVMSCLTWALGVHASGGSVERYNYSSQVAEFSSDLLSFEVLTYEYKINFSEMSPSFGTGVRMEYQTNYVDNLEKYAFVQFIQGCVYSSRVKEGKIQKEITVARDFFGDIIKFKHPDQVIDSIDLDPMYNNWDAAINRHGAYRFMKNGIETYYLNEKPETPSLFATDLPSTAFFENDVARNVSLKFKTCLYKTKDIPLVGKPEHLDFASPLKCFNWASSKIYNFEKDQFYSSDEIDPFCLGKEEK